MSKTKKKSKVSEEFDKIWGMATKSAYLRVLCLILRKPNMATFAEYMKDIYVTVRGWAENDEEETME